MTKSVTPQANRPAPDMPSLGGPGGDPAEDQIDLEQAIAAAAPPLPPELVVTGAFGDYSIGYAITDPDRIRDVLATHAAYVVPRYPQVEKSSTEA